MVSKRFSVRILGQTLLKLSDQLHQIRIVLFPYECHIIILTLPNLNNINPLLFYTQNKASDNVVRNGIVCPKELDLVICLLVRLQRPHKLNNYWPSLEYILRHFPKAYLKRRRRPMANS